MARASQADLDAACEVYQFLAANLDGRTPDRVVDEFGYSGYDDCHELCDYLAVASDKGSLFRVIWGMHVLLDPNNQLVDPDCPHLEEHPHITAMRDALRRLAEAAKVLATASDVHSEACRRAIAEAERFTGKVTT